jgi:Cof subfamily protein (haloacid dehalogenase superfamily)
MIVSDLDGTLLGADTSLSDITINALRRAADRGVVVVAATGRSRHSALDLLRPAAAVSWALCSNGATRYDLVAERLIHHRKIPALEAASFLADIRSDFPMIGVAWETERHLAWDEQYERHRDALVPRPARQEGRIAAFPEGEDLIKLLLTHPDLTHQAWLDTIRPRATEVLSVSTSGTDFVEVTHATATKGQAIAALCEELEIDRTQVVAFGDQVNDLDMLQWAGRGYAMANASSELKSVASHEAPHHADDGVAVVLHDLLDRL